MFSLGALLLRLCARARHALFTHDRLERLQASGAEAAPGTLDRKREKLLKRIERRKRKKEELKAAKIQAASVPGSAAAAVAAANAPKDPAARKAKKRRMGQESMTTATAATSAAYADAARQQPRAGAGAPPSATARPSAKRAGSRLVDDDGDSKSTSARNQARCHPHARVKQDLNLLLR